MGKPNDLKNEPEWGDSDRVDSEDNMEVSQGSERMREKRGNDFAGASLNKIRGSGASWGRIRGESSRRSGVQNHFEIC